MRKAGRRDRGLSLHLDLSSPPYALRITHYAVERFFVPGDGDGYSAGENTARGGKLIELRGHHAAEQALDALLRTVPHDPQYPARLGHAIAAGPPILAAVVRRLDL